MNKKNIYLIAMFILIIMIMLFVFFTYFYELEKPDKPDFEEPVINEEIGLKQMVMQSSFKDLYEQNNDVVGWISIEGTKVDYPVVQFSDNEYYLDRNFDKQKSSYGSIMLDYRSDISNMYQAAHQIVYGHNVTNGTMFQDVTNYYDEEFFNNNKYIIFNTLYGNYTFEIFSVYETPITFNYLKTNFYTREAWFDFIKILKNKSAYENDVEVNIDDVVLTLSTCTLGHDPDYRFVVHARLINPEEYDIEYDYIY